MARPQAICIKIEPIRKISKVLFLKTKPNSELSFSHLELFLETASSFHILKLGIKFLVPMLALNKLCNC